MNIKDAHLVAGPDGTLTLGNKVIELTDESRRTFHTDNLKAFEEFSAGRGGEAEIYFSASEVLLVTEKADKNFAPMAVCKMSSSPALQMLSSHVGQELDIVKFERMLTALRKYAVGPHMGLLSQLRNFAVAKKQTYERDLDNAGNFRLLIQREAIAGDWVPPQTVTFCVPLFTFVPETVEITCDLVFTVADGGAPVFRLENMTFAEEVLARRVEVLDARLGVVATCPKYWGSYIHHPRDNAWKFKESIVP